MAKQSKPSLNFHRVWKGCSQIALRAQNSSSSPATSMSRSSSPSLAGLSLAGSGSSCLSCSWLQMRVRQLQRRQRRRWQRIRHIAGEIAAEPAALNGVTSPARSCGSRWPWLRTESPAPAHRQAGRPAGSSSASPTSPAAVANVEEK